MPETKSKRGGARPNTGGVRPGAGRKTNESKGLKKREATVSVKVEQEIKDWLDANKGKHYDLLRKAFNDALIV